jgi:IS5 family transposase
MSRMDFNTQLSFFQTPIEDTVIDMHCRDQMPKLLSGIKEVYINPNCRNEIIALIKRDLNKANDRKDTDFGRPGLNAWEVFVLLSLRQNGKHDYDKIADLATNHIALRSMMNICPLNKRRFSKSTIHDNIKAIQPETIQEIDQIIIKHSHSIFNPTNEKLELVADTFVYETNIHFHADYVSIMDGVRCLLRIGKRLSKKLKLSGFRKSKYINEVIKRNCLKISKLRKSSKKNKEEERKELLKTIITLMNNVFEKIFVLLDATLMATDKKILRDRNNLEYFLSGTCHEADLAIRRIFEEDKIESKEKIFSLFEAHTELICKGKSKAPMEFGHRVIVIQDQFGLVLACKRVESGYVDADIIVDEIEKIKTIYPNIKSLSLDKGFWSPKNKTELEELVEILVLPNKGKRKKYTDESDEYKRLKNKHSKVESCINALEQGNNLGVCLDKGLEGFDRSVSAAGLSRNLHELGNYKLSMKRKEEKLKLAA